MAESEESDRREQVTDSRSDEEAARLYATTVEMADRVSARRGQANQFYLSIETLLLGVPAFFGLTNVAGAEPDPLRYTVLAAVGVIVSVTWWLQLRSYRQLNRAKFDVILAIEREHFQIHPFGDEWDSLKKDAIPGWRGRYAELGTVERVVPIAFLVANLLLGVWAWV